MSAYLKLLIAAGVVPFLLSFYPPLKFYRNFRGLVLVWIATLFIFGGWDVWATARGHWLFAPDKVGPMRLINLPLEEVLFFIVIPFCCLFTWEVMNYLFDRKRGVS